jgi:hypothetical protein
MKGLMKKQIIFNWGEFNERTGEDVTSNFTGKSSREIFRPNSKSATSHLP